MVFVRVSGRGTAEVGEMRKLPRAAWACTQLDEAGRLAPLADEGTAAARPSAIE